MKGASFRFDDNLDSGNLGPGEGGDNLNSLDVGANVYHSPNGGLNVRVTGVRYLGPDGADVQYAGETSDQSVTASLTNYVYLDQAGAIQINTTGFPTAWHLPLAEVACSSVTVTGITNRRRPFALGVRLPAYAVTNLPVSPTGYPMAFATDGRKTGETATNGTGVVCYWDGTAWRRVDDGTTVLA
jgi:hypothetical protein